jgi:hypothetical protein
MLTIATNDLEEEICYHMQDQVYAEDPNAIS